MHPVILEIPDWRLYFFFNIVFIETQFLNKSPQFEIT